MTKWIDKEALNSQSIQFDFETNTFLLTLFKRNTMQIFGCGWTNHGPMIGLFSMECFTKPVFWSICTVKNAIPWLIMESPSYLAVKWSQPY